MNQSAPASLLNCTLEEFLDRLADRRPTPGGGSAAAAAACLTAAIGRMLTAFAPRPDCTAEHLQRLDQLAHRLQRADLACRRLIDEDAAAFEALSRTRRMDRVESPRCSVQDAVRVAIAVPLSVTALSLNVLRLLDQDKALFKSSMLTDLSVAADLGAAACRAASRTASGNLVELDNPADQKQARDQLEACRMQADQICNRLLAFVAAHTQ